MQHLVMAEVGEERGWGDTRLSEEVHAGAFDSIGGMLRDRRDELAR